VNWQVRRRVAGIFDTKDAKIAEVTKKVICRAEKAWDRCRYLWPKATFVTFASFVSKTTGGVGKAIEFSRLMSRLDQLPDAGDSGVAAPILAPGG
jgi:hypothetical protein